MQTRELSLVERHSQERGSINRHVQHSWIERKRQEKQQACNGTAKAALRWKAPTTTVVASKSLRPPASAPKSRSDWSSRVDSGTNNAPRFPSHHTARSKPPLFRLCGKDDAVDPFASTAIKIDSNVQDLMLFYISASRTPPTELLHTVHQRLFSESQSYPLLAFAAAWMENSKAGNFVQRRGLIYQQKALEKTQALLQSKDTSRNDMLWNIANMSFTAIYQKEDRGTIAHLQAADYLISQANDFEALDPIATVQIMSSDHHQAHSTLTPLVLRIDQHFAPYTRKSLSDPKLAEIAGSLLLEGTQLPPNLIGCLEDIFQLATVVESSWVEPAHSLRRSFQLLLDIKWTTPRLLPVCLMGNPIRSVAESWLLSGWCWCSGVNSSLLVSFPGTRSGTPVSEFDLKCWSRENHFGFHKYTIR
jgi:hypothetical protein